ncbi:uncharacterized protein LOC117649549 [Thrips palmi]|uniref:Uncharacterized protein LOC117649549 n=1 Tax=Thrips palmi TaxID=161013 RepID=A0A6P8ZTC0_THRPL|nr:uncharacterized protein LOC117649549 [Thrips palmi]
MASKIVIVLCFALFAAAMICSEEELEDDPQSSVKREVKCKPPNYGFANHNRLGFACATFELLLNLSPFVEWLRVSEPGEGFVTKAILEIYDQMSKQIVDVELLKSRIKLIHFAGFESGDHEGNACLFLSDVIDTIDEEMEGIHQILGGVIRVIENCSSCGNFTQNLHKNTMYPIHLDSNSTSVQQGIDEYNMVQFITCDKCLKELMIIQSIEHAPNVLILKIEDLFGSPNIDLFVEFGGAKYDLHGLVLKDRQHYQTIAKSGPYWFQYNDSSVRSIKLGQLICNDSIKSKLYMCAYVRVTPENNNMTEKPPPVLKK